FNPVLVCAFVTMVGIFYLYRLFLLFLIVKSYHDRPFILDMTAGRHYPDKGFFSRRWRSVRVIMHQSSMKLGLTFDDVLLVPKKSPVSSRNDVDITSVFSH